MQSIQREISNAESSGTTMNQNLNDEVLDKVQKDLGFNSKEEAAKYLTIVKYVEIEKIFGIIKRKCQKVIAMI